MTVRLMDMVKLYEAEYGRLLSFVRRLVGNAAVAEDLVQQTFMNLIIKNDPEAETRAYVGRTARNLAFNHLRNEKRRNTVELSSSEARYLTDPHPSPETTVLYRSELHQLLEIILHLPARRREAFLLNKAEGLCYDEVAKRMDISRNTVISHVIAAMAELDRRLSENNVRPS